MSIWKWNKAGLFVGGMLFATKGVELLKTKEAHNFFVDATAFGLRLRDELMKNVTAVREECEDVVAEAVIRNKINELSAEEPKVIEDKSAKKAQAATAKTTAKTTAKKSSAKKESSKA